jgi:pimeloyl-ACP methyl ester carboxylesterase
VLATYADTIPLALRRKSRVRRAKEWGRPDIQFMDIRAASIRYRVVGERGPVLAICPDPPVLIEHYDELAQRLSGRFRLLLFELPGFGFSIPKIGLDLRAERVVFEVAEFLRRLEMGPYILSFPCVAGLTAVHLAHAFPELVRALVLVQTPDKANAIRWKHARDPGGILHTPVVGQVALNLLKRKRMRPWFSAALADASETERYATLCESAFDHGACFCLASAFQQYLTEAMPEFPAISQPALAIWGGKDRSHRATDKSSTLGFAPNAELRLFEQAGHFPDLEDPDRFEACLIEFVEGWERTRLKQQGKGAS